MRLRGESKVNKLAHIIVSLIPQKRALVVVGARLPPYLRSALSYRFFSALARQTKATGPLRTNLGISAEYDCLIPSTHHVAIFGKPNLYVGESGALDLAATLGQHTDAFVDVGAHVGYFTFFMRNRLPANKPIYFFEPDPQLFQIIDGNVRTNHLSNVSGFQKALGAVDGTAVFHKNLSDSFSGSLETMFVDQHEVRSIEVAITRYDSFAASVSLQNACVKVDVEGAERDFMKGSAGALETIRYLIMEVLGPAHERKFVAKMIDEYGFHAYYIHDHRLEYSLDGNFHYQPAEYNWLFCRENPATLRITLAGSSFKIIA